MKVSKRDTVLKIEEILSYLLSRKYNADIRITFKKEKYESGDSSKSTVVGKK